MLSGSFPASCGPGLRSSQKPQCQSAQEDPQARGSWPFSMKRSKKIAAWSYQLSAFREKLYQKHEEIALLRAKQRDIKLKERLQIAFQRCQSLEEKLEVVKKKLAAPRDDGAGDSAAGECETCPSPSPRALLPVWEDEREAPMASWEDPMDIRHSKDISDNNTSDNESSDVNCSANSQDSLHSATEEKEVDYLGPLEDSLGPGLQRFHLANDSETENSPLDVTGLRQFGKTASEKYKLAKKQELLKGTRREDLPFTTFTQWDAASVALWMEISIISSGRDWANKFFKKTSLPEVDKCLSYSLTRISTTEDMSHEWICWEWLPSLGLPQYCSYFLEGLVDSRMLSHLTEDILRRELKMAKRFHRSSFMCGVMCLQKLNYDRKLLERRRLESQHVLKDVLVWSNERITCWVQSIGLSHYALNLLKSGLHGAVITLQDSFNSNTLADILKIPKRDTEAHSILRREFNELLLKGTERQVGEEPSSDEGSTDSLLGPPEDSDLQPLLLAP